MPFNRFRTFHVTSPMTLTRLFRMLSWPALLLAVGCSKAPPTAAPDAEGTAPKISGRSIEFSAHNPQLGSLATTMPHAVQQSGDLFTGRVTWNEDCTDRIFSPVAGQVEKVGAEVGQTIKKGDDLALMHSADYGQAQADYRKALGDYAQFDKALARVKTLKEHGAAAQKDVESAQADFDRGLAEKERAEASLQLLGTTSGNFNDVYPRHQPHRRDRGGQEHQRRPATPRRPHSRQYPASDRAAFHRHGPDETLGPTGRARRSTGQVARGRRRGTAHPPPTPARFSRENSFR